MTNLAFSPSGLAITKQFEGLKLTAYQDQVGKWTIGYGHTGPDVVSGLTITEAQAEAFLEADVAGAVAHVNRVVTAQINQNHFDALVDFAFNLGCGTLSGSTLLHLLNQSDFAGAAAQFLVWDHAGGAVVPGLLRRRTAEMTLFQTPMNQAADQAAAQGDPVPAATGSA